MNTKNVFSLGPNHSEGFPRVDFSKPENQGYDWLAVGEMVEGRKELDWQLLSSINFKVTSKYSKFDCLSFDARLLVSESAKVLFERLVPGCCRFLSVRVNDLPFHILLAKKIVDALDKNKSEIQYFPKEPNRIMLIRKYCFQKHLIPDPALFRIPENIARIFVTDLVKEAIEKSGLIGFQLVDFESPHSTVYIS